MNPWQQQKPLMVLAPMYDVTDTAFRQIIAKYSKPQSPAAFFTEFVSVEGLASSAGQKLEQMLWFDPAIERPIIAKLFGATPSLFERAARRMVELGFDGIDINMGCPDCTIMKQGSCSALIDNPKLVHEIIAATKAGAGELPVSVKTRIGTNRIVTEKWITYLLQTQPAAITVHGRTAKEMSKVPCHWDEIGKAVAVAKGSGVLIVGNGDVVSLADAREKVKRYGVDGIMLGRAIFGNPWLFAEHEPSIEEKLRVCIEHTRLFEKYFVKGARALKEHNWPPKNFAVMKKHYKAYVNGFDGAKELRIRLMDQESADGVVREIERFMA